MMMRHVPYAKIQYLSFSTLIYFPSYCYFYSSFLWGRQFGKTAENHIGKLTKCEALCQCTAFLYRILGTHSRYNKVNLLCVERSKKLGVILLIWYKTSFCTKPYLYFRPLLDASTSSFSQ